MNVGEWLSALTWRDALDFFILFVVLQRQFVQGIVISGLKG